MSRDNSDDESPVPPWRAGSEVGGRRAGLKAAGIQAQDLQVLSNGPQSSNPSCWDFRADAFHAGVRQLRDPIVHRWASASSQLEVQVVSFSDGARLVQGNLHVRPRKGDTLTKAMRKRLITHVLANVGASQPVVCVLAGDTKLKESESSGDERGDASQLADSNAETLPCEVESGCLYIASDNTTWGRLAAKVYCGDFYQLPPVPAIASLLALTTKQSYEHQQAHIGRLTLAQSRVQVHDEVAASLQPCGGPGTIDVQCPFEAQGRGFQHGHGTFQESESSGDERGDASQLADTIAETLPCEVESGCLYIAFDNTWTRL